MTEAVYAHQGYHYVLMHTTGIVDDDGRIRACDDVTDVRWVSSDPARWPTELPQAQVVPQTDDVVRRAVQYWKINVP